MALRDDEQRILTEIERALVEEDPRLARRFGDRSESQGGSLGTVIAGVVMTFGAGLGVLVAGIWLTSPALVLVGVVVTTAFPALAGWRLSARRRGMRRRDR